MKKLMFGAILVLLLVSLSCGETEVVNTGTDSVTTDVKEDVSAADTFEAGQDVAIEIIKKDAGGDEKISEDTVPEEETVDVMEVEEKTGEDVIPEETSPDIKEEIVEEKLSIKGVFPDSGLIDGGYVALVKGTGFKQGAKVYFGNNIAIQIEVQTSKLITCIVPKTDTAGSVDVKVVNPDDEEVTLKDGFLYLSKEVLTLTEIIPSSGLTSGGYVAILKGTGFKDGIKVYFGDNLAYQVEFQSSKLISCIVPQTNKEGSVDVKVVNPDGEDFVLKDGFLYVSNEVLTISSITPTSGSIKGGYLALIKGAAFDPNMDFYFGENKALEVNVVSSQFATVIVPPSDTDGSVDVKAINSKNEKFVLKDGFLYVKEETQLGEAPVIGMIFPSKGGLNQKTPVLIFGSNFVPESKVFFGENEATSNFIDKNTILAFSPESDTEKIVDVSVKNPDNQKALLKNAFKYTDFTPTAMDVTSIFPQKSPVAGGGYAIIEGEGFLSVPYVIFGTSISKKVYFVSDKKLIVKIPEGETGSVDLLVINPDGNFVLKKEFFSYYNPDITPGITPQITGVYPQSGSTNGGDTVEVKGAGFDINSKVFFNETPVEIVGDPQNYVIKVKTPPHDLGGVDVMVVNSDGRFAVLENGYVYISFPPFISEINPTEGDVAGGYTIDVYGKYFSKDMKVFLGEYPVSNFTFIDSTHFSFVAPPHPEGYVDLTVINPDGLKDEIKDAFLYKKPEAPKPPEINQIIPNSGSPDGGYNVVIIGKNFQDGAKVYFGENEALSVNFSSDTVLTVVVPKGKSGEVVDVKVENPDAQSAVLNEGFTYTKVSEEKFQILKVTPDKGSINGGDTVTIIGSGFKEGMTVLFGDALASNVSIISKTVATAETPAHDEGVVNVTLKLQTGEVAILESGFTFINTELLGQLPEIYSISPNIGPVDGGILVEIHGKNFDENSEVWFGTEKAASVQFVSKEFLIAKTPAHDEGTVTVSVVNPSGQTGILVNGFTFYNQIETNPPVVLSITPSEAPVFGNIEAVIKGINFKSGIKAYICDKPIMISDVTSEEIKGTIPPGEEGMCDVTVVNPDGQTGTLEAGFKYIIPAPKITQLIPETGDIGGGTPVVIYGEGFISGSEVYFGENKVEDIEIWNKNTIKVITPAHDAGKVDVTVKNPNGEFDVLKDGFTYIKKEEQLEAPQIDSITPSSGPKDGGTIVTITGKNFTEQSMVFFGGIKLDDVTFVDSGKLKCVTKPSPVLGFVPVTVLNPDGLGATAINGFKFIEPENPTPVISGITPDKGPQLGGTLITISGKNFSQGGIFYLGGKEIEQQTYVNDEVFTGVTPPNEAGVVDLTYVGEDGQVTVLKNAFTYVEAPQINKIEPQTGPVEGNQQVSIYGKFFQEGIKVYFGETEALSTEYKGSNLVVAITPPAQNGGSVDVKVVNPDKQWALLQSGYKYVNPPEIYEVIPAKGSKDGGTPIRIIGKNFTENMKVYFGDVVVSDGIEFVSDSLLKLNTPAHDPGKVDVSVENEFEQKATLSNGFEFLEAVGDAPVVESIFPQSGSEEGGNSVIITGQNLKDNSVVLFGDVEALDIKLLNSQTATVTAPPHSPAVVSITWINPDGQTSTLKDAYEYKPKEELAEPPMINLVKPVSGTTKGSEEVHIFGANFTEESLVFFGEIQAPFIDFISDTELKVLTPEHDKGKVDVKVLNPDGQSAVLKDGFEFIPPPVISEIVPDNGASSGGTEVTISGQNFVKGEDEATSSRIILCSDFDAELNCVQIDFANQTVVDDTKITFITPKFMPGFCDIEVINPDGQFYVMKNAFYFNPAPEIDSVNPASGTTLGGDDVTIEGNNFNQDATVYFGEKECLNVSVVNSKTITCTTPANDEGYVDVSVTNPDGSKAVLEKGFLYKAPPVITKVYPLTGIEDGGFNVTIEGDNFIDNDEGKSKVYFGEKEVPSDDVTVLGKGVITVVAPAGTGTVIISVINPDGQKASYDKPFTYLKPNLPPEITTIYPKKGSNVGGYPVQIIGKNFLDGVVCYFGKDGNWIPLSNPVVKNMGTLIIATAPSYDGEGLVDVRVVNTDMQEDVLKNGFEYYKPAALPPLKFDSITPAKSSIKGGIPATISGQGFKEGISVFFGKDPDWVKLDSVQFVGTSILKIMIPESPTGDAGKVDIMLVNPGDGSDYVIAEDAFEYGSGAVYVDFPGFRLPAEPKDDRKAVIFDANNDGKNDVVVFRNGWDRVLFNVKNEEGLLGWFVQKWNFSGGYYMDHYPDWFITGDFDNDGDDDIFIKKSGRFNICKNDGNGNFKCTYLGDYTCAGWTNNGFVASDFNCDGYLDIFVARKTTNNSCPNFFFINYGDGTFYTTSSPLPSHFEHTNTAAAADVDLDGDVDLLLANDDAMQNRLYYNNCNNILMPPSCYTKMDKCTYFEYKGHTYAICNQGRSWWSAKKWCETHGFYLATIDDEDEQNFISSKIGTNYWIGYNDIAEEGKWEWVNGDSTYTFWCGGEPNNAYDKEDCAVIKLGSNGCWNDYPCSDGRYFICETEVSECQAEWKFEDAIYGSGKNFPVSGYNTKDAAFADIDGNGYPDAIIANWGQGMRIYMNYGGNFMQDDGTTIDGEGNLKKNRVVPVDIDNDGDTDLVVSVEGGIEVYVNDLNNGGSGTLKNESSERLPGYTIGDYQWFTVGDIDGDLLPDIYIVNRNHQDRILINNGFEYGKPWINENRVGIGKFVFNTIKGFPEDWDDTRSVVMGDIDNDGDIDIIKAQWHDRVKVYINNGDGTFSDETEDRTPDKKFEVTNHGLALGDLDGDGDLDLVIGTYYDYCNDGICNGRTWQWVNDGTGHFKDVTSQNMPNYGGDRIRAVALADIDNDNDLDIILGGEYPDYMRVLINGGDPFHVGGALVFNKTGNWFSSKYYYVRSYAFADINGDGFLDLYIGRHDQNKLLLNVDGTKFVDQTSLYIPAINDDTYDVIFHDFDKDGDIDIFVANWGTNRYHIQEIDGKYADVTTSSLPQLNKKSLDADIGDADGDGLDDIIIGNWEQKNNLLLNIGESKFIDATDNLPDDWDGTRAIIFIDFDGDGDLDIFTGNAGQDRLYINTDKNP